MVGVNSQREIEQAAAKALAAERSKETCPCLHTMTREVPGVKFSAKFAREISRE